MSNQFFGDRKGNIEVAHLAPDAVLVRVVGFLSERLAQRFAEHLARLSSEQGTSDFYVDITGITRSEVLARSAIARALVDNRQRFRSITLATRQVTEHTQLLQLVFGSRLTVLEDLTEFKALIVKITARSGEHSKLASCPPGQAPGERSA